MGKNVLFTGASGFLGRDLVKGRMSGNNDQLYLIHRSDSAKRIMTDEFKTDLDRISFIQGDIESKDNYLGMSKDFIDGDFRKIDEVWHLAASTSFDEKIREKVFSANVGGTRNVLETLTKIPNLSKFYYMGTAYVAGKNQGV